MANENTQDEDRNYDILVTRALKSMFFRGRLMEVESFLMNMCKRY